MARLGFVALCALATQAAAAPHSELWPCAFFVSPSGDDASNGTTLETPFRTLGRAQAALRELVAGEVVNSEEAAVRGDRELLAFYESTLQKEREGGYGGGRSGGSGGGGAEAGLMKGLKL